METPSLCSVRNRLVPTEPSMPDPDAAMNPVVARVADVQIGSGRSCQTSPVRPL